MPIPLNAMISSMFIAVVLSLLNLGGSEAFNSIMGLVTGAVGLTYALSISCVVWRKLYGAPLPAHRWSLGRAGIYINIFAVLYEAAAVVISFFPLYDAVTAKTMNWVRLHENVRTGERRLTTGSIRQSPCLEVSLSYAQSTMRCTGARCSKAQSFMLLRANEVFGLADMHRPTSL